MRKVLVVTLICCKLLFSTLLSVFMTLCGCGLFHAKIPNDSDPYEVSQENAFDYVRESSDGSFGNYGRFYIPAVGVEVGLNYYDWHDGDYGQALVDAKDSAGATHLMDGSLVVMDHWNQGFINIKDLKEGDAAFIKKEDGTIICYTCSKVTTGYNTGECLYDSQWVPCTSFDCDLYCYTCNGNWQNIYLVFFDEAIIEETDSAAEN